MNKELKKLKKLAEKHFYRGKDLTKEERFVLENSQFAGLVKLDKSDFSFYKILEQYGEQNNIPSLTEAKPATKPFKRGYLNMGVNKRYLDELIDDVEEEFNLGVFNRSLYKYESVDLERLKQYIDYHCQKNMIDKEYPGTCKMLTNIIEKEDSVYDVMYSLYAMQR